MKTSLDFLTFSRTTAPYQHIQEKAAILLSSPYRPASKSDTAHFVDALNAGDIGVFAGRLSRDAAMLSEDGQQALRGQIQILNHFTARLDTLSESDTDDYLAVLGKLRAPSPPRDADDTPCALFYDGFRKTCVLQLGVDADGHVARIVLSGRNSVLRRARPSEPPAFRDTAILPPLTEILAQR